MAMITGFDPKDLYDFTVQCFEKAGFDEEDCKVVAGNLQQADLRGLNTHGVLRIPMYLKRVLAGVLDPHAKAECVLETSTFAIWDAKNGMGCLASEKAMNMAIEKAKETGIYMVGVRNSNHFGTAAYYTMKAASQNMIGFCCSNTEPLMPATGGAEKMIGNNPFSIAFPGADHPDIVVDMAVSAAAIGKILLSDKKGIDIPNGWATDKNGVETNSTKEALEGFLLPVGGPKGYGLGLAIDILAGLLTGAGFSGRVRCPFHDYSGPQELGHLFLAIDIEKVHGVEEYLPKINELIERIKGSKKAPNVNEIFMPGEIEYNKMQKSLKDGVDLPEDLFDELQEFAGVLGVENNVLAKYKK